MTPEEINARFANIERILANHQHLDYDKTKKLITPVYGGQVASDGSAVSLPIGWTSARNSTGRYTITHNLGTTAYAVVACALCSSFDLTNVTFMVISGLSVNTFQTDIYDGYIPHGTNPEVDRAFLFILKRV